MSKHYSCEQWEWKGEERRDGETDKLRQRSISILKPAQCMEGANKYSHANGSASLEFMQT